MTPAERAALNAKLSAAALADSQGRSQRAARRWATMTPAERARIGRAITNSGRTWPPHTPEHQATLTRNLVAAWRATPPEVRSARQKKARATRLATRAAAP
jgi:hypothetical protein